MILPERVGVIGGGRMGAGIAHAFLLAGSAVTLVERDGASARAARQRITASLQRSHERGATERPPAEVAPRLRVTTDAGDLGGSALVVEAVFEDRDVKTAALRRAEAVLDVDAVLASNTSAIPIGDLAAGLDRPDRLLGLHFFNPVPSSAIVEIVVAAQTAQGLVETAREWVLALGKTPIVVRDAPGFASSRLGVTLALEAIRMLEDGVATATDIDAAMELGYRHATGPLRTTDIVGLDVRLDIAEQLHAALGERFAPPELLRSLVADGHLGRKSGRGFYEWSTG